jgi:hypothetical protein
MQALPSWHSPMSKIGTMNGAAKTLVHVYVHFISH